MGELRLFTGDLLQAGGEILCSVNGEMERMVVEALVPGCMGRAIQSEGGALIVWNLRPSTHVSL